MISFSDIAWMKRERSLSLFGALFEVLMWLNEVVFPKILQRFLQNKKSRKSDKKAYSPKRLMILF